MSKHKNSTRTITLAALMTALCVLFARGLGFAPVGEVRISFESGVIFLSGVLLGPVIGGAVGLASDVIGSVFFSAFGFNPIFCLPPVLYGICGGLARPFLKKKASFLRITAALAAPVIFGSIIWQSFALDVAFKSGFLLMVFKRSLQFSLVWLVDVVVLKLLFDYRLFEKLGIWKSGSAHTVTKMSEYEKALQYIHSVSWKGSVPGLERTRELLRLMGNPEKKTKFIHIAGTNGKGSTASMTANILFKAGYTTGLYTSPYIFTFNERMKVNGENISDRELVEIVEFVKPFADSMSDAPTEFELITCIAFEFFKRRACDVVCLEAGMGGELDATNVIDSPVASVITNIGLDHTEYLGSTLEEIAATKSKIIKEGSLAVVYRACESVERVFEERCREVGASLVKADFDAPYGLRASLEGQVFDWKEYKNLSLPLLGAHQIKNVSVVLTLVDELRHRGFDIPQKSVREGLKTVYWPGRFEVVNTSPLFIVDGGHNPQCIEALVENVKSYLGDRKLVVLTGVLADKDYEKMYSEMSSFASEFITVTPPNPRALKARRLKKYLEKFSKPTTYCISIEKGVALAKKRAGENGVVLAYGSLYMVADIEKFAK